MVNKMIVAFLMVCSSMIVQGQVTIHASPEVKATINHYSDYYRQYESLRAFRVQISSTTDRREMDKSLSKFKSEYPDQYVDWEYNAPYYRVKVGAFLTRWDAEKAIYVLRKSYPGSIIIFDDIPKDQFLNTF